MKGSLLLTLLAAAVLLAGAGTACLGVYYEYSLRRAQKSTVDLANAKNLGLIGSSLVTKSLEYRQKNPNIERILRECNVVHPALSNLNQTARPPAR